jgi:hypothetical protein
MLFAGHVEERRAHGILVDISRFRHTLGPGLQEWRVRNISRHYFAAGVRRFAFLFPDAKPIPAATTSQHLVRASSRALSTIWTMR